MISHRYFPSLTLSIGKFEWFNIGCSVSVFTADACSISWFTSAVATGSWSSTEVEDPGSWCILGLLRARVSVVVLEASSGVGRCVPGLNRSVFYAKHFLDSCLTFFHCLNQGCADAITRCDKLVGEG